MDLHFGSIGLLRLTLNGARIYLRTKRISLLWNPTIEQDVQGRSTRQAGTEGGKLRRRIPSFGFEVSVGTGCQSNDLRGA